MTAPSYSLEPVQNPANNFSEGVDSRATDCGGAVSPNAASHTTCSTSSPTLSGVSRSISYPNMVQHQRQQAMVQVPLAPIPSHVNSAAWAGGSPEPVPTVITTAHYNASGQPSMVLSPKRAPAARTSTTSSKPKSKKAKASDSVNSRRQKRLERNRESARLSRRRRKQYLEVLEERVTQLAEEMDAGRRAHAKAAIPTLLQQRQQALQQHQLPSHYISRTAPELSVLTTFQTQQLKSFVLPAHVKFVLWLTLQGDTYYRGGRAASERLSAARIGERMLHSGNDKVTPIQSMWPLFCNEVGLSYDQEERVRNYQRALLQEPTSFLERHTARASGLVMQSFHDALDTVGRTIDDREKNMQQGLTTEQKVKFLQFASHKKAELKNKFLGLRRQLGRSKLLEPGDKFPLNTTTNHVRANLYILNHRLQQIIKTNPQEPRNVVPGGILKRLSRRPSFESLGQQHKEDQMRGLSRDSSFASSGSLVRSPSSLSMMDTDSENKAPPIQVTPEDGQDAAVPTVENALGAVKELIPPQVVPTLPPEALVPAPVAVQNVPAPQPTYHYQPAPVAAPVAEPLSHYYHAAPPPAPQVAHYYHEAPPTAQMPVVYAPAPVAHAPAPPPVAAPVMHYQHQSAPQLGGAAPTKGHVRKSSFLPPYLNVVPEEMFPNAPEGAAAEDFFMSLMDDEDWAIGEGVDMDTTV